MQGYITLALVVSKQIKTRQIKMFEFVFLEAQFRLGKLKKKSKTVCKWKGQNNLLKMQAVCKHVHNVSLICLLKWNF